MGKTTYHGSCHCKRVRFEADIDLEASGTGKCNCSYCWKVRNWSVGIKPADFRILEGEAELGHYGFRPDAQNHHVFCKHCGVRLFTKGHIEQIGGDYVSVMLSTLDDLPTATLTAARVQYMNGRDDDWFHEPSAKAHL